MIKKSFQQPAEVKKNMRGGEGEVLIRHHFRKEEFNARCRLCAQLTLAPGAGIGLHEHVNEDEVFIIQQGVAVVIDDDREIRLEAGDAILTGKGGRHAIRNAGAGDLLVTAVIIEY